MEYEYLHFPAEAVNVDRFQLARLPGSARRVFEVIKERGPVTRRELSESADMPARTVRYAIKRLKDEGLVDTRCSLRDCRTCYFFVHERCVGVEALEKARRQAKADAEARGRTRQRR